MVAEVAGASGIGLVEVPTGSGEQQIAGQEEGVLALAVYVSSVQTIPSPDVIAAFPFATVAVAEP